MQGYRTILTGLTATSRCSTITIPTRGLSSVWSTVAHSRKRPVKRLMRCTTTLKDDRLCELYESKDADKVARLMAPKLEKVRLLNPICTLN